MSRYLLGTITNYTVVNYCLHPAELPSDSLRSELQHRSGAPQSTLSAFIAGRHGPFAPTISRDLSNFYRSGSKILEPLDEDSN